MSNRMQRNATQRNAKYSKAKQSKATQRNPTLSSWAGQERRKTESKFDAPTQSATLYVRVVVIFPILTQFHRKPPSIPNHIRFIPDRQLELLSSTCLAFNRPLPHHRASSKDLRALNQVLQQNNCQGDSMINTWQP